MSKAFDKVNHAILINKLEKYNIRASLLKWFSSYSTSMAINRVTVLGVTSSPKISIHAFLLQHDLDNLNNWSSTSGINFHELKCKRLLITRKAKPMARNVTT
jgi:hypothetical protein